jgi:hypothetical protein
LSPDRIVSASEGGRRRRDLLHAAEHARDLVEIEHLGLRVATP